MNLVKRNGANTLRESSNSKTLTPSPGGMNDMSRDDFGVPELLRAADVLEYRCSGACLEHIDTACIRWVDLVPQQVTR